MDFFEYATIALQFVNSKTLYVPLIVGALCFLTVFVFQAIGLYTIAAREGLKNKWMAFVPFLNTYYIGVCGQKNRAFASVNTKTLSLAASILEALLVVGHVVYYVAVFKLFDAGCVFEAVQEGYYGSTTELQLVGVPVELAWAAWCFECLYDYILVWVNLIFLALRVFVLSAFFQSFAARRYFLFTITRILFPIQGILIFIVRNNTGMNYREFLRREQERQYRIYQQYTRQNYESNPYDQNPYSRGGYENPPYEGQSRSNPSAGNTNDDPFSGLGNEGNGNGGGKDNSDPFDL